MFQVPTELPPFVAADVLLGAHADRAATPDPEVPMSGSTGPGGRGSGPSLQITHVSHWSTVGEQVGESAARRLCRGRRSDDSIRRAQSSGPRWQQAVVGLSCTSLVSVNAAASCPERHTVALLTLSAVPDEITPCAELGA